MIFGVIGNFIVFYVYFIRLNCKNVEWYFVLFLVVVDFVVCVIGFIFFFLENVYVVIFFFNFFCKIMWYIMSFSSGFLIFVLFIIVINCYFKLCRFYGR